MSQETPFAYFCFFCLHRNLVVFYFFLMLRDALPPVGLHPIYSKVRFDSCYLSMVFYKNTVHTYFDATLTRYRVHYDGKCAWERCRGYDTS